MLVSAGFEKAGRLADDAFAAVADDAPLSKTGGVIVSLKRYLGEAESLSRCGSPVGVRLESHESPEALRGHLDRIAIVVLHMPYFKDGRAFSWARLLRTRLGYTGEIRLTGHYLRDQIAFFARVGVDSFELPQNLSAEDIAAALGEISHCYQPSVDGRKTILDFRAGRRATRG